MKKTVALLLAALMLASLVTGCGGKSETASGAASAAEAAESAAPDKSAKKETTTYRLIRFEANGYVAEGADLKDNGMDNNTYAELSTDGTGVVCIMGAANDITWGDKGSIKINNYPVYTFDRIDDETIAIDMQSSRFIMSSNEAVLAAAQSNTAADEEDEAGADKPAGSFSGEKKVYTFAGLEAKGQLQDGVQQYLNTGGAYDDTSLVLNGDGTGSLIMEGMEHEVLWENGKYVIQDMMNCTLDEVDDGMYEFDLYGMMKMRLASEDYTNLKADRSNLKTIPYGSYNGEYGSAGYLNAAKTIIISIFVNDDQFGWTDSPEDLKTKEDILKSFKTGTDWLSDKIAMYGYDSTFIYDWTEDADLAFDGHIEGMSIQGVDARGEGDSDNDAAMESLIKQANVDEKALKQKYGADNLLYVLHVNDGGINYNGYAGRDYAVPSKGKEYLLDSGAFADVAGRAGGITHEMLHLFGAPDLYEVNPGEQITPDYIGYMYEIESRDIMFYSRGDSFVGLTYEFGPVTAYYLGLEEEAPEDVIEFGLGKPEKKPLK